MKILRNILLALTAIGSMEMILIILDPSIMSELFGKFF
jgi:hypothetical protein